MKALLSKQLVLITLFIMSAFFIKAQTEEYKLNLVSTNKEIEHVFHITISKKEFKKLSQTENVEKNFLSNYSLTYNEDTLSVKELELRGKSSMCFARKSFSIKLNNKIAVTKNSIIHKFKKFNLISLSMDHNYYSNKVAFDLMNQLNLFNLFYTYAEVIINDETQGIYLMLQKPKGYAFKQENTNFMLRRGYESKIKKTYYQGNDTTFKLKYEKAFNAIYNELMQKEGQVFYEELSEVLDVEQYFTWMAFNFLMGNRDYTDEVFFFNEASGDDIKFKIIPWDYDDLFFDHPHEGSIIRLINFGDKLAFSSEDYLDFKLISNQYTYTKYLQTLSDVIEELSDSTLKSVFELAYQELYPYYCKKDILKISKVDKYGKTDLNKLELSMQNSYKWLIQKRETTAKSIQTNITH